MNKISITSGIPVSGKLIYLFLFINLSISFINSFLIIMLAIKTKRQIALVFVFLVQIFIPFSHIAYCSPFGKRSNDMVFFTRNVQRMLCLSRFTAKMKSSPAQFPASR